MKTFDSDSRRAWGLMIVAVLVSFAMSWAQAKIPPVIGDMMNYFSISMTTAGWLSSIVNVVGIAMALPAAGYIQRLGIKKSGLIAIAFTITGGLIGLFSTNIAVLLFSRFVEGIGTGVVDVLIPLIISMWFPSEKRGIPTGLWCSSLLVAQSASFVIADSLTPLWGWRGMWIFGLVLLCVVGILYFWRAKEPSHSFLEKDEHVSVKEVLRHRSVWLIAIVAFLYCVSCFGWSTWAATYWSDGFGMSVDDANNVVGLIYMAEIFIAVFNGWLLNRILNRKLFLIIMSISYGVLLFFSFRMTSDMGMLSFAILYPFLESAVCTGMWILAPQTVPKPAFIAIALAIVVIGMDLGMVVGPPLIGYVVETFSWHTATILFCVVGFISSLCVYFTKIYPCTDDDN